ncbi:SacI homology domain-containing protein [Calycina marina]|uniref:SacI homology domain-containing protein n=1 Tax=Calycina marina TaxID=1763456 RepID=A0A9P7YXP9_9HELO|nr:SacI homology domain-containing protein [Calycina marina]
MTSPLSGDFVHDPQSPEPSQLPSISRDLFAAPESKAHGREEDEEGPVAQPFQRNSSPSQDNKRNKGAGYGKVGDQGVCKMHKFSLYETAMRYYLVGADVMDRRFRILKIDRMAEPGNLSIAEDEIVYNKKEMSQLLNAIDDGNKSTGGMKLKCSTWGLLGFIRFTGPYYMLLIMKRSQVAMIGGHFVYQVDGTELIPLTTGSNSRFKSESKNPEEARFLTILHNLDLTRSFYFSYSYDITRTLQHNICAERACVARGDSYPHEPDYNTMFVWNSFLLQPANAALKNTYDWCLPVIHGYIDQAALSVFDRTAYITVIARRSRFFAGARFLKRGANDLGYVANDVETEQIVSEVQTTSLHSPPMLFTNPNFTSYVQHRGSIPLYWTQDNTGVTPKPPIELNLVDPFYSAAALHFDNLFERYGAPVYVLNLVKAKERKPRESKLLLEYTNAIDYLNQFLPEGNKIIHKAWDMSRASKTSDEDVIGTLEAIAEEVVITTGLFHNGDGQTHMPSVQNGVARTNCIDCLDRTNAAQFVIGKRALGHQLHALGILADTSIDYDTDAVNLFTHMFHDHGDTIAMQYGGSQLVNTMETYRKINQWTSHSRDMVESFKRYYHNSFMDGQRQEAYNLFLGNYIWTQGGPMLWDLTTDYYLHHADPRAWSSKHPRSYTNWFTPEHLATRTLPPYSSPSASSTTPRKPLGYYDDYWPEYYKPLAVSSVLKVFSYKGKMNSTQRYWPADHIYLKNYDYSPFKVRTEADQEVPERKRHVKIQEPEVELDDDAGSIHSVSTIPTKRILIQRWLQPIHEPNSGASPTPGIMKMPPFHLDERALEMARVKKLDKTKTALWTFTQVVSESLNPYVTEEEGEDYARYISHPQTLPLVVSDTLNSSDVDVDYLVYVNGSYDRGSGGLGGDGGRGDGDEEFEDFLTVAENPLTVFEEDLPKKRYKAYKKWLAGKSLFKQQPIE